MLWPPIMWMQFLGKSGPAPYDKIPMAAELAMWFWPLSGGLLALAAFYILRLNISDTRCLLPLAVGLLQIGVFTPATLFILFMAGISGTDWIAFALSALALTYVMYRIQLFFIRKAPKGSIEWTETPLAKAHVFSFFGIPLSLCVVVPVRMTWWL
jgi:hypothetical protein